MLSVICVIKITNSMCVVVELICSNFSGTCFNTVSYGGAFWEFRLMKEIPEYFEAK